MSKEKNTPQEPKKESISLLEKIRRRTGLLVGIVGLALIIFILESLLGSGASIFGGDEMTTVGHINGRKIDRNEFIMRLENQMNNYKSRNQGREPDEQVRGQAVDGIIQQYVLDQVMMPQFEKAGIRVGEDELYENVVVNPAPTVIQNLTDPNTGKVNEQFSRPDGSLDPAKWRQAVQNVTGESEMAVRQMEDMVKSTLFFQKFRALVNKGLYVTRAEAKAAFRAKNTTANIEYVVKRFDNVSDSTVKVTDDEIEKFYKSHTYLYKNPEDTRKVEYVTFNVTPSPEDMAAIEKDANRVAAEFKGKSFSDDSVFMAQESENGNISIQDFTKKSMIVRDSSIFTAAPGTVFGPYNEGAYFKIYKLEQVNTIADSAKVRHILIGLNDPQTNQPKRSKQQAKREADSLLTLIKEKKVTFDTLVTTVSDDMGSKTNGGDYGWFDENKGFVDPFKNAGLQGTKGNISVVETQFGYHIIEVLDVSKNKHTSYKVAQIFKPIVASDETNQKIFSEANQFAGENNTPEAFDKAVEQKKLIKRQADNVREGEYVMPGLEGAKEIVKWSFTAKKGEIAVFSLQDKHVVAKLASIRKKGTLPLEEVKEDVTMRTRQAKKAEMFTEEFRNKAANAKSISEVATKLGLEPMKTENFSFEGQVIPGIGRENALTGTVEALKPGAISKPFTGGAGVFVAAVTNVNASKEPSDLNLVQKETEQAIIGRTDYEVFNALKDASDIEFHKSRID